MKINSRKIIEFLKSMPVKKHLAELTDILNFIKICMFKNASLWNIHLVKSLLIFFLYLELGMSSVSQNSLDAVSDRDFVGER